MLDTIFGLPLHPLIVHATVVIVPAAALAVLLAAVLPRFRRWAGPLPLVLSAAGLFLVPLSTDSGEALRSRVGDTPLVREHAELADMLLPWMILLTVVAAAQFWFQRRERRGEPAGGGRGAARWLPTVVTVVGVLVALGTTVQVVLIGHSGAKAAWHNLPAARTSGEASGR